MALGTTATTAENQDSMKSNPGQGWANMTICKTDKRFSLAKAFKLYSNLR